MTNRVDDIVTLTGRYHDCWSVVWSDAIPYTFMHGGLARDPFAPTQVTPQVCDHVSVGVPNRLGFQMRQLREGIKTGSAT